MKECKNCHKVKSLYKFDTHRLGTGWTEDGKGEQCRKCESEGWLQYRLRHCHSMLAERKRVPVVCRYDKTDKRFQFTPEATKIDYRTEHEIW